MTQTAIVAGGTGALGAAVTAEFLAAGWRVVVPGRKQGSLDALGRHERLHTVLTDVGDPAGAAATVELADADEIAPLTAVVSLVGGFAIGGRVHETPVEAFEDQLRLNLRPTYVIAQAAIPALLAHGGGAIVCTSSRTALRTLPGATGYVTAKTAVLAFVDNLAAEYRRDGIRVNAILPGTVDTPANRAAMPDADHSTWTPPAQIARVVRFLAEDPGVSGGHIPV